MKKVSVVASLIAFSLVVTNCSSSSNGSGSERLTTAGKMSTGLGSSISTIQNVGGALGGNGSFSVGSRSVSSMSAATKCTAYADPGSDGYNGGVVDGVVDQNERYSQSDVKYALQKLYCTLAADTSGPESVSGSVKLMKTVICAVEKQIGSLAFDNVAVPINGITLDLSCATQSQINGMTGTSGQSSVTLTIAGGALVTSALIPTFSEIGANGYYSHGVRIASNTANLLKFIVVAKFDPAVSGDPVQSGNFEFATYGTGTMMQGTGVEYTAGKISGGAVATRHLWYESRLNRIRSSTVDPVCGSTNAGDPPSSSCGFARHTRLSTDISFSNGDISSVSNMTAIISDGGDSMGSTQTNQLSLITASGNLSSGLYGKIWTKSVSPAAMGSGDITATFTGPQVGTTSCILSSGSAVTSSCGGSPAFLSPAGRMDLFFKPANSTTWFMDSAAHSGVGFTGAATFADEQFSM